MSKPRKFYYRFNTTTTNYTLLNSQQKRINAGFTFTRLVDMEYFLNGYTGGNNYTLAPAKKY